MPLEGRSSSFSLPQRPSVQTPLPLGSAQADWHISFPTVPCSSTYWAFAPALLSAPKAIPCSVASPLSLFNTYFKFHSRFTSLEKCMIFQTYTCIL